jgi:hypothetical protein
MKIWKIIRGQSNTRPSSVALSLVLSVGLPVAAGSATLPPPWGALSTGTTSASVAGVSESWLLANSFEDQAGLSEAIMVANERMNVTTQLVTVGAGTLSFSGGGITFTGFNLAPGHPNNNVLDTV